MIIYVTTECQSRVVNNTALYSGGPRFVSRLRSPAIRTEFFVVFLRPFRQLLEEYLKVTTASFQILSELITQLPPHHSTLHSLSTY